MASGWIKLHRELLKKAIWQTSTPVQKTILITIMMLANHTENEWEFKGEKYVCKPGEFITSLASLQKSCGRGITSQNIRTALVRFEKYGFLTNVSTRQNRLITVVNWELYQSDEKNQQSNQQTPNKRLTNDQQTPNKRLTTNKNDKNNKNVKNERNKDIFVAKFASDFDNPVTRLTRYLIGHILKNNPNAKVPDEATKKYDDWCIEIDRMHRIDNYSIDDIKAMIDFSQKDNFWASNILSTKKLRAKAGTLIMQIKSKPQKIMERMKDW